MKVLVREGSRLAQAMEKLPGLIKRAQVGDRKAEKHLRFAERYGRKP